VNDKCACMRTCVCYTCLYVLVSICNVCRLRVSVCGVSAYVCVCVYACVSVHVCCANVYVRREFNTYFCYFSENSKDL